MDKESMKIKERKAGIVLTTLTLWLIATAATASSPSLTALCEPLSTLARWLIGAGYIIAAVTLVQMAVTASFSGRFPMPNFVTWACGLFVLSSIPGIVSFLISGSFLFSC